MLWISGFSLVYCFLYNRSICHIDPPLLKSAKKRESPLNKQSTFVTFLHDDVGCSDDNHPFAE